MKNNINRIARLEKAIQEILNPEEKEITSIVVDERIGETEKEKISEMEIYLGRKLKRNNILLVCISNYKF